MASTGLRQRDLSRWWRPGTWRARRMAGMALMVSVSGSRGAAVARTSRAARQAYPSSRRGSA